MPTTEIKAQPSYPNELVEIAQQVGYKAANLEFLDKILLKFSAEEQNNIKIEIPKHISISNQAITAHLDQYASNWREQWDEFCAVQGENENLKPEALATLKAIQANIHQAFIGSKALEIENLDQNERWMVRSTGEEDRVDVANPGGNESVPSDSESINPSIAQVVASYFSEKSMSQRLKSGEKVTAKPPLMPCLIQKLIGETPEVELPPVSGVIYTDTSGNVRIQAAYGHGELVVNSKGNFDNIFVTKENVVHQYLGNKKIRLVPKFDLENKKISLEEASNSKFAKDSSLDEEVSMNLAKFANFVESEYGMRMDLEFVFDPNSKMINIVQARPIPEGKRKGLTPSALSDDFITSNKPIYSDGQIITPDVMSAKAIKNKDEILVCDEIGEALGTFLNDKNNKIKAVITKNTAPDTSHEAGFFSSQAIPVIQAEQYDLVKSWADNFNDNLLIIDPQHASIYQVKQSEFQDSLIKEGIFRSTLSPYVTPNDKRKFAEGPSNQFPEIQANSIGELVIEARNNPEATQKLFRFIHDEIGIQDSKVYDQITIDQDIKQLLSYPVTTEDFQNHRETLAHLLNFVTSNKNEKEIAPSTYEQLIITGMELNKALKEITSNPQNDQVKMNYFNIHKKFQGLMTSEGTKDILSTSFRKESNAHDAKELLKKEVTEAGFDLSLAPKEQFLDLARHKAYLFREEDHQKWLTFCYETCQKNEAESLQTLVNDITELELKDNWINVNFLKTYGNDRENILSSLQAEYEQNLVASENILKASGLIDRLEHQIGQWSDPKNFNKLFENELKKNIIEINQMLKVDSNNKLAANLAVKQLYRLTDVIDLSIKQLQNSHLYENKEQQVENFRAMLGEFFTLMHINVEGYIERTEEIKSFLNEKSGSKRSNELLPSRGFSVINADFFQDSNLGFSRGFTVPQGKTLADLHTLIHQTLLGSVARKSALINPDLIKTLPESVIKINNNILNSQTSDFANYPKLSFENLPIKLLYINTDYPQITLNYKVPLRSHSGTMKLIYDIKDQNIKLDFTLFGRKGTSVLGRWGELEEYGFLLFEMLTETKLIEHKGDDNLVYLQLEIKQDNPNLKELFGILKILGESTMGDNTLLSRLFQYDGEYSKMLSEQGLSPLILASHRESKGKLDFKALHKVIKELKNPTEFTQKNQEIAACLRLMAMDNMGEINHNKLKALEMEFSNSELNVVSLIIQNFDKFPNKAHAILIGKLINIDQNDKAFELAKRVTDQSELKSIATMLINQNQPDKALELAEKITDQSELNSIATMLINQNQPDKALELAEKITDQRKLADIATALIGKDQKDQADKAIKIAKRITEQEYLVNIATTLIYNGQADKALELAEKITDQDELANIATMLIYKDQPDKAIKIAERITDQSDLASIATMLIDKHQPDKAIKITERITDQSDLASIATMLIDKHQPDKVLELTEIITNPPSLENIAKVLIEKNQPDKAIKIAERITYPWSLASIATMLIDKHQPDKALELAGRITNTWNLKNIATALINKDQPDKAIKITERITDQRELENIATMLIDKDQTDKAIKIAERITNKSVQIEILEQFASRIHDAKDPKYGQVISAIYDLAAKQKNEETIKKLLPYTPKSNVANGFKDSLQFPTIEEISPPASNIDYVAQGYEKPTISQSNQQFIAQHDSQRTTMGDNPTLLKDPSYNVGFMDNLNLLRVGSYITQSAFNIVKDSWINMFGANANNDQVKEARKNSKIQFNSLKDPLMDIYKEIIEIYESKIKIHNNKSDKALYDEIAQLKQFKEQAEEIMKDLRESSQWSKEFKANLNENKVIKQAQVELLEQKIIKISQTSEKFFEAIEKNRESSKALKKTSAQVEGSYYNAELANMLDKNPKARIAVPKESLDWPKITELDQNINLIPHNRSLLPDSKNKPIKSK